MTRKDESPEFVEFWETIWLPVARHTDGRGLARDAFRKHVSCGAEPRDIIDGARWFVRSMKDRDREFVPLSATWLNREAYQDLAAKERAFQARQAEKQSNVVNITQPVTRSKFGIEWDRQQARKAASE